MHTILFPSIQPDFLRQKLTSVWASCLIPLRRIQKYIYTTKQKSNHAVVKVQYERWKTVAIYQKQPDMYPPHVMVKNQEELVVDNPERLKGFLISLGLQEKSIREMYRETWVFSDVIIYIDRWPWLRPFLKITCENYDNLTKFVAMIWYEMQEWVDPLEQSDSEKHYASMWDVGVLYMKQLQCAPQDIQKMSLITFDNPPVIMQV